MIQFILENIQYILPVYFILNAFISGAVFDNIFNQFYEHKWVKGVHVLVYFLFGIFLLLFFLIQTFILNLFYSLHLKAIFRLYFSSKFKKGNITPEMVRTAQRIAKYHKNSGSLSDRIYRWYTNKIFNKWYSNKVEMFKN